ncbi:MAG: 2-oxo-4-hydroxy-4-carboxy-5-ureidoimidazoline decarboxylase [Phototrophicaceae bacterium]
MKLSILNTLPKNEFLSAIGGPLEGEIWLAERIVAQRPFTSIDHLMTVFETVIAATSENETIKLIQSHPDLAPTLNTQLSETSQQEQAAAGLTALSPSEYDLFQRLNAQYHQQFGFPFVICARHHTKSSILEHFEARLNNQRNQEIKIGIAEILKIIHLRLTDLIDTSES